MKRRNKHRTLGNPALIAAAASNPQVVNTTLRMGTILLGGIVVAGAGYLGWKAIKKQQKINLFRKAATDPNVKAAVDIFNAIPERMKKDTGTIFSPGQLITDWINNLMFWTKSDSDRILLIAERIQNFDETTRVFRILYDQDLIPLLENAMSPDDYDRFVAAANRDKNYFQSSYSATDVGKIAGTRIRTLLMTFYNGKVTAVSYIDANRWINGYTTGTTYLDKYGDFSPAGTLWVEIDNDYVRQKYKSKAAVKKTDIMLYPSTADPQHKP